MRQVHLAVESEEQLTPEQIERARTLNALAEVLCKSRAEAISFREMTGIEREWAEDEEFYEGVDDANRHENAGNFTGKPWLRGDPVRDEKRRTGSTVFPNITRPYTDVAAARLSDMLLPTDDEGWTIKPTPIADSIAMAAGTVPRRVAKQIAAGAAGIQDEGQRNALIQKNTNEAMQGEAERDQELKERCARAATRIKDWHVECQFHGEVRRVIDDMCRVGTGVLKGPIPTTRKEVAWIDGKMVTKESIVPMSVRVDYRNCFPTQDCGQSVHDGSGFWERDSITEKQLEALIGDPNYLDWAIDMCLEEGPMRAVKDFSHDIQASFGMQRIDERNKFEIWYFHGRVNRRQLEELGVEIGEKQKDLRSFDAALVMVNTHVIKATMNHLDTGEFPYDFAVWQRRDGLPWGIGVPRQMRTAQRMVTAATRALMDNAGVASGPIMIYDDDMVTPADGGDDYTVLPWRVFRKGAGTGSTAIDDVRKALAFIEAPMRQEELLNIIQYAQKLAEDVTGQPMLLQGQQGSAPETVGGMKLLNENASAPVRRSARLFDVCVIEPHITRYYHYLMQYGEDDNEKGDFQVDAKGSAGAIARDIEHQELQMLSTMVMNPVFGIDPKKWMKEFLKSQHTDPKTLQFDDPDWKKVLEQLAAQAQAKPGDAAVQVAQIRAESTSKDKEADRQHDEKMRTVDASLEDAQNEKERQYNIALKTVDTELEKYEIGSKERIALEKLKGDMARDTLKLKVQLHEQQQVVEAPTEPPGRAPDGQAFAK